MKTPILTACIFLSFLAGCATTRPAQRPVDDRIPVILDTDIGNDIDDTWAIAMLLRSPRFDVKLITTTDGQPEYRGRLVAKLLTIAGRTDIPIGLGPDAGKKTGNERESRWIANFQLADFQGTLRRDGAAAIIDTINASKRPITVIGIGPLQTLATALDRDPSIAGKADFVGMQGSVFKGYGGKPKADAEFNVKLAIPAAQKVLSAPWHSIAITPLDTCGLPGVSLSGEQFQSIRASTDPLVHAIVDAYAAWDHNDDPNTLTKSTVLYDTVAIYLADPDHRPLLELQTHPIQVTDKGFTVATPTGRSMTVATGWTDLGAYREYLVNILLKR